MKRPFTSCFFQLAAAAAIAATLVAPAFAGLPNLNSTLSNITSIFTGAAVAVVTLATMWVGYKTLWAGAHWQDISKVVIGAVIIGGASAIGALLTSGS